MLEGRVFAVALLLSASLLGALVPSCSTFSEEGAAANDDGGTPSGDSGGDTSAVVDAALPDDAPTDAPTDFAPACNPKTEVGETYNTTELSPMSTYMVGDFLVVPETMTPGQVIGESVDGSDRDQTKLASKIRAAKDLAFFHGPALVAGSAGAITRVWIRAWLRRDSAKVEPGSGLALGLLKGLDPSTAPKFLGDMRPIASTSWVLHSEETSVIPGTADPFGGPNDINGVTILLRFEAKDMNGIHVSRAWIEVCRQKA